MAKGGSKLQGGSGGGVTPADIKRSMQEAAEKRDARIEDNIHSTGKLSTLEKQEAANRATANAMNKDAETVVDMDAISAKAKEGKFTKVSDAPTIHNAGNTMEIQTKEGYAYKADGNTFIITKQVDSRGEPTKGYVISYNGVKAHRGEFSSLKAAKEAAQDVAKTASQLFKTSPESKIGIDGMFATLNRNKGKINRSVWEQIDTRNIGIGEQ